jgi:uncharacterized membrane protein YgcG
MLCDASALAPHCACGSASWRLTHVTQTQSDHPGSRRTSQVGSPCALPASRLARPSARPPPLTAPPSSAWVDWGGNMLAAGVQHPISPAQRPATPVRLRPACRAGPQHGHTPSCSQMTTPITARILCSLSNQIYRHDAVPGNHAPHVNWQRCWQPAAEQGAPSDPPASPAAHQRSGGAVAREGGGAAAGSCGSGGSGSGGGGAV